MSVWSLALGESESGAGQNRIDFRIRPSHPIRVEWSLQNHLLTPPTQLVLSSTSPSVLRKVHLPVVRVVQLRAPS